MKTQEPLADGKISKALLDKIKEALRKWYGTLSVKEIIANRELIAEIESFERMLSGQEAISC
jgi:hypothetical protein